MKTNKAISAKGRERKMLLILPLLIIPFTTLAFWALGGGKGGNIPDPRALAKGLNLNLPDAAIKDESLLDKLGFYDKAERDSIKRLEQIKGDPYFTQDSADEQSALGLENLTKETATKYSQRLNTSPLDYQSEQPDQKVMKKLARLQEEINKPASPSYGKPTLKAELPGGNFNSQVDRLEELMNNMKNGEVEDPEIKQLEGTLDKILDIQHPERVKERLKSDFVAPQTLDVSLKNSNISVTSMNAEENSSITGFFTLEGVSPVAFIENSIRAVVHESQTLVNGGIIKLRLLDTIRVKNVEIPKGNFVFGLVSLSDERLVVQISSIRFKHSIYPVSLQVFDLDGMAGIHIPGAISRDVAKQSADNSLQVMDMSMMDQTLKAKAATAGISAAKSLISRKVKLVRVAVKAEYQVLLVENKNQ